MNLSQIEYFIAVAESLSFSKAAQKLHISQPSVSRQIAYLEQELGLLLLIRNNKMVKLTPEGEALYKDFRAIYKQINETLERIRQNKRGIEGKLIIGCIDELNTSLFLPDYVKRFTANYPKIEICLERCSFKGLRNGLINGDLDIIFTLAFSFSPVSNTSSFSVINTDTYLALPFTHPLAHKEDLSFDDLEDEALIIMSEEESPECLHHGIDICTSYGFHPKDIIQVSSFETQFLYLESGLGFSLLDPSILKFGNKNLRFVKLEGEHTKVQIDAIWRSDNNNLPLRLFTNLFINCIDLTDSMPT